MPSTRSVVGPLELPPLLAAPELELLLLLLPPPPQAASAELAASAPTVAPPLTRMSRRVIPDCEPSVSSGDGSSTTLIRISLLSSPGGALTPVRSAGAQPSPASPG